LLTAGGNVSNGNPDFDVAHSNIGTTAALSVSSLSEARSMMRRQTALSGRGRLNITPRYLIVPASLENTGEQLLASLVDPARSNDTTNPGWVRGLELVVDARLDDNSETAWYVAGGVTQVDTVEVGYLDGQRGVYTETEEGFDVDGRRLKARLDFNALVCRLEGPRL
jgi:hypothetical protein